MIDNKWKRTEAKKRADKRYQRSLKGKQVKREYQQKLERKVASRLSMRKHFLMKLYSLTVFEYDLLLANQNGCCAICKKAIESKQLSVDHDHVTGKVRGLLCNNCNLGLGNFKDDEKFLLNAVQYLIQSKV